MWKWLNTPIDLTTVKAWLNGVLSLPRSKPTIRRPADPAPMFHKGGYSPFKGLRRDEKPIALNFGSMRTEQLAINLYAELSERDSLEDLRQVQELSPALAARLELLRERYPFGLFEFPQNQFKKRR